MKIPFLGKRKRKIQESQLFEEDYGWRPLTTSLGAHQMRIPPQDKILQMVNWLWASTPFGRKIPSHLASIILGRGVKIIAENEAVQNLINDFIALNRWNSLRRQRLEDLIIDGELFLPIYKSEGDGMFRLGYIPPENVKEVFYEDSFLPDVPTKIQVYDPVLREHVEYQVVRFNDQTELWEGEVFYLAINKRTKMTRGLSDLYHLADYIDAFDELMFSEIDRTLMLRYLIWHVKLIGADEHTIRAWKERHKSPPKPGSVIISNENEEWKAISPDLKMGDISTLADLVISYIATGASMSKAFLNATEEMNRATVAALSDPDTPFAKFIEGRQELWKNFEYEIFSYLIQESKRPDITELGESEKKFTIIIDPVAKKDVHKGAETLQKVTMTLLNGLQTGMITPKTAAKVFLSSLKEIGYDIDVNEEIKKIFGEEEVKEAEIDYIKLGKKFQSILKSLQEGEIEKALELMYEDIS